MRYFSLQRRLLPLYDASALMMTHSLIKHILDTKKIPHSTTNSVAWLSQISSVV